MSSSAGAIRLLSILLGVIVFFAHQPEGLFDAFAKKEGWMKRNTYALDNGTSVSYMKAGTEGSRRIIYVHGTPGGADNWDNYIAQPIAGAESFSIDRPGFGYSIPKVAEPSLQRQAAAILPLLADSEHGLPILVGHSLGGPIIARAAVDYPDKVGGLVIVAGALDPELERIRWYNRLADFPLVKAILPKSLRISNDELLPLKGELSEMQPLLANVRCPVIIIHGTRDFLVPVGNVDFMQREFGANVIESIVIEDGDHFLIWNQEKIVRSAIEKLLTINNERQVIQ